MSPFYTLQHNPMLAALLMGGLALLAFVCLWKALLDRDPVEGRLKNIVDRRAAMKAAALRQASQSKVKFKSQRGVSFVRQAAGWLKLAQLKGLDDVKRKLVRAGWRSKDALLVFLFLQIVLPLLIIAVMVLFLLVLTPVSSLDKLQSVVVCLFVGILAGLLPNLIVKNQTSKRLEVMRKALPDAYDLLVICAEAGLSLDAGLDRVQREIMPSAPDLGEELGLTGVELSFLPDRQTALRALADRVPLPGIKSLVSTLIQTERYGTPLAHALRILSTELRDDRMMKAEEKAARLPAILTVPMILFILPPLFVVLIGPAIIKVITMSQTMG